MTILLYRSSLLMILYSVIRGMDQGWFCNTTYMTILLYSGMTILLYRGGLYDDPVTPRDDDSVILQYLSGMWSSCYSGIEIGHISFM